MIRDQSGAVIPGLSLSSDQEKRNGGLSDINGQFTLELSPGDHVITASDLGPEKFRAFIKIVESGPNPDLVEFVVNSSGLCKELPDRYQYPSVTKSVVPPFPSGGIRALGTVYVMVKVGSDGKVNTAAALSGHPLHKAVSVQAARKFEFDASSINMETEVPLRFIFIDGSETNLNLKRFSCDYRIVVNTEPALIEVSEVD